MKIFVNSHNLDTVMRMTFAALSERRGFEIIIVGPGEADRPQPGKCRGINAAAITSKITPKAVASLRRLISREKPDAIFSASTSALSNSIIASAFRKVANVGYRGTQHRIHRTDPFNYLALLNPRVSHVVCETTDIHDYLTSFIPARKLSTHPKPYALEWVEKAMAAPAESPFGESALRCVYIGATKGRPFKGLHILIEAMRQLEPDGVTLTVVGEAGEEDMASAPANVRFLGHRSDAIDFLPGSDLFILPSTRDASPRVVREAQACAVPCIVTDIPGARDLIVDGSTGLLVAPGRPQPIVEAVRTLMADRARLKEMGAAARRHIADNYKVDSYIDYFENLFKSLDK